MLHMCTPQTRFRSPIFWCKGKYTEKQIRTRTHLNLEMQSLCHLSHIAKCHLPTSLLIGPEQGWVFIYVFHFSNVLYVELCSNATPHSRTKLRFHKILQSDLTFVFVLGWISWPSQTWSPFSLAFLFPPLFVRRPPHNGHSIWEHKIVLVQFFSDIALFPKRFLAGIFRCSIV
jgi:hypothetical protein